ncbi:hypothetical protein N136_04858, partial [Leifsonia aquatica ATCC 14665]
AGFGCGRAAQRLGILPCAFFQAAPGQRTDPERLRRHKGGA